MEEMKYIMIAILFLVSFAIGTLVGYVIGTEKVERKSK